ncbi:MAG: TRAP transporter small permease [Proteobacteria bacterium]|nr:TRAP transporter small permease [Pseudomonadota bacterium]
MIALLVMVMANILGRIFGFYLRGADAYAGYCMAGASFFALAYALCHGDHIRVTLLLHHLKPAARRAAELWCLGAASFLSGVFAFYSVKMVWWSYTYHDISQANDATPLWIPELAMAIGTTVLFAAFVEEFVHVARGGKPSFESAAAQTQHTE